jgi:hypothetical protein
LFPNLKNFIKEVQRIKRPIGERMRTNYWKNWFKKKRWSGKKFPSFLRAEP